MTLPISSGFPEFTEVKIPADFWDFRECWTLWLNWVLWEH